MRPQDIDEYALAEYALAESEDYASHVSRIPMDLQGKTVLDLAAGPGTWSRLFLESGAETVVWTDNSWHFLTYARDYLSGHPLSNRAAFVISDLLAIPFEDDSFDLVFCRLGLHHSSDEQRTLDEVGRVLRKGGLFVLIAQRRGLIKNKGPRWPKRLVQYASPWIELFAKKKLLPTRYHIRRVLLLRIARAGLVVELEDASNPTSLFLLARKPLVTHRKRPGKTSRDRVLKPKDLAGGKEP